MKKQGFTLAEILITLGIIGVVAALTVPMVTNNAGTAHVGPTLQKTVATIAVANETIMHDALIDDMDELMDSFADSIDVYLDRLSRHIAGSTYESVANRRLAAQGNQWQIGDTNYQYTPTARSNRTANIRWEPGVRNFNIWAANNPNANVNFFANGYTFFMPNNVTVVFTTAENASLEYQERGAYLGPYMQMDIDINGKDSRPNVYGIDIFRFIVDRNGAVIPWGSKEYAWLTKNSPKWNDSGDNQCNKDDVQTGFGCAGSIFENNLKVIYQ